MGSLIILLVATVSPGTLALVQRDGVGRLPALGWSTWNAYGCDIDEAKVLSAAESMITHGFKDSGYEYVNIDDCWSVKEGRDNVTQQIIPDLAKFPSGIDGLATKVHAMGLKLGIYSSAGTVTCEEYPASLGYEEIDATTWAAWGIDYLKYDNCGVPKSWADQCSDCTYRIASPQLFVNGTCIDTTGYCPEGYDYTQSKTVQRFRAMRNALLSQNRTIEYSLCVWGSAGVQQWGNDTGNSWRMSTDIRDRWGHVAAIMNMNSFILNDVDFWGHNDADMLEVGNGGLTIEESRTHFAMWAAMKSPLMMGAPLANMSQEHIDLLRNNYILRFNQDAKYGAPAKPYKWGINPNWTFNATNPAEYWSGKSEVGTMVFMMNTLTTPRNMTALFSEIPELKRGNTYIVTDVWAGKSLGRYKNSVELVVAGHDTAVLLLESVKHDIG